MGYNALQQLTEVSDWLGVTSIDVDPLGRATKVTNHRNEVIEYTYGKAGERRSTTYPNGKMVNYHYDEALRLTGIQDGEQFTNYIYDKYSRLIEKQYPNETATEYAFNKIGQLQSLIHSKSDKDYRGKHLKETLDQLRYEYDLMGNKIEVNCIRKGKHRSSSLPDSGRYTYQYDPLNRLTRVMGERDTLRTYQYDSFGNRVKKTENGRSTSYTYNSLNQLIGSADSLGERHEYLYDGRGNLKTISRNDEVTQEYSFGDLNRLEKAINHEKGLLATYDYNGLGHRVRQTFGDSELFENRRQIDDLIDPTKPFHNLLQRNEAPIIREFLEPNHESAKISTFTYDFGVLSGQIDDKQIHYLHDDLGSPIRTTSDHWINEEVLSYDEFGVPFHNIENTNSTFTFTGYQFDPVSDTYFSPSRAYNPELGRFISEDTHWQPYNRIYGNFNRFVPNEGAIRQSGNLYEYAIGNPLKYIDLLGTEIILTGTPEDQQRVLDELNTLVGSTGNNPILSTTLNESGSVVVYFTQPPNPNHPQSTELVERLVNSEFTTEIVAGAGVGHVAAPTSPFRATRTGRHNLGHGSGTIVGFDTDWAYYGVPRFPTLNRDTGISRGETMPDHIILGHELIHAERNSRGAMFCLSLYANVRINLDRTRRGWWIFSWWSYDRYRGSSPIEEIATIGLRNGEFNDDCDITENDLRQEHGLDPRSAFFDFPR